ncbi:DUF488 family protein [Hoylesella timonensis]|nr:DUF488 domain-containing protein [Hoylesella timonensis]
MEEGFLFSIGHGNKDVSELIEQLHHFNIEYLIDVRSVPYSKFHPQFNKEQLMHSINQIGNIKYVYMGDVLGGLPKDELCKTNGKMDYDKMKQRPVFQKGIQRLLVANEKKIKTCIMCSESNPADCHRTKLIGEVLREHHINLLHICTSHEKKIIIKSQQEVINEITKGNNLCDLFGNVTTFMSRNNY